MKWGDILVLGTQSVSSSRLTEYLNRARLEYVQKSLLAQIDAADTYAIVFVCNDQENASYVGQNICRFANSAMPTVVVTESEIAAIPISSTTRVVSLPGTDADFALAFNQVTYGANVIAHSRKMHEYSTKLNGLSARERLVVQMAADGVTNRRIARVVGLAEKSVERERSRACKKLGVQNSAEMMRVVNLGCLYEFGDGHQLQATESETVQPAQNGTLPTEQIPAMGGAPGIVPPITCPVASNTIGTQTLA